MDKKTQHMHNASKLIRSQHSGVLSTLSLSLKGFPFGSVTPFLMTESGDIVIYASDIAQHSRNMKTNDKVSLFVHDINESDSQASARVTIVGNASVDSVDASLQALYFKLFPQAKAYVEAHDFRFYLINTHKVRYIGGFGEIYWFSQSEWSAIMYPVASSVDGAIEHMHTDHADALSQIVAHATHKNVKEGSVTMVSCFQHGFHYTTGLRSLSSQRTQSIKFITFMNPISDNYDLRHAMVDLTKSAGPTFDENLSQKREIEMNIG